MKKMRTCICLIGIVLFSVSVYAQGPSKRMEAEDYSKVHIATTKKGANGIVVNKFSKGAWVQYDKIDFGKGIKNIKFKAGSGSNNGLLEVRSGDEKGELLGKLQLENTKWRLKEQVLPIKTTKGMQTITIVSPKNGVAFDWFELL